MTVKFVETPAAYLQEGEYVDLNQTVILDHQNDDWEISLMTNFSSEPIKVFFSTTPFTSNAPTFWITPAGISIRTGSTTQTFSRSITLGGVYIFRKTGDDLYFQQNNFDGSLIDSNTFGDAFLGITDTTELKAMGRTVILGSQDETTGQLYNLKISINGTLSHHWPLVNSNYTDQITGIAGTPVGVTTVLQDNYHNVEKGLYPDKFGGKIEIDGTKYTIAELQASTYGDTIFSSFRDPKSPKILTFDPPATADQKERIQYEL